MNPEQRLPYQKPWILIDRVISFEVGKQIITIKQISSSDFFLQGHFPDYSIYPGMLLLEGIKQSAELLIAEDYRYETDAAIKGVRNMKARFFQPVLPGDTVTYIVNVIKTLEDAFWIWGEGKVMDYCVIKANIKFNSGENNG